MGDHNDLRPASQPVALVAEPDEWEWRSFRSYAYGKAGVVRINYQEWPVQIKYRRVTRAQ
ncbi:MAG: hypothetical protein ACLPND_09540 [Candidatus Korobacteraceae bacterium]